MRFSPYIISQASRPHLYKGENGKTYVGFGEAKKVIELDLLLPQSLRGLAYDDVVQSQSIGQFFDLADMVLISGQVMDAHIKSIDMTDVSKANPVKTKLPAADLDYLRARDGSGNLLPGPMKDIFSIVVAYWDSKGTMGIKPGLVASLWRRGMSASDIVRSIRASTGKDGQLIKATGRGHDIMHTVIEAYLLSNGLPADAEFPQAEMGDLVERWLTATRSAPLKSADASNSVLHWSDYRRLGLVDQTGAAQVDQVRQVALQVFAQDAITFAELSAWVDENLPPKQKVPDRSTAARAMLKKKRKQGKLNRKRGRR